MSNGKNHKSLHKAAILSVSAIVLTACGGGGGGGLFGSSSVLSGLAVDGYVQGATVFLDINKNGVLDAGEPSAITDATGKYTLDYSAVNTSVTGLPIVVTGGIDTDTGNAFTGQLSARVDKATTGQVVSPLTSLIDAVIAQGLAADVDAAKTMIASGLGLTVALLRLVLTSDPVAAIASNPAIYSTAVTLQRSVQLLASANSIPSETAQQTHERVVRALASAVVAQASPVNVSQLIAASGLQRSNETRQFADTVKRSIETSLSSGGHDSAKKTLRGLDKVRVQMETDGTYSMSSAADKLDAEKGLTTSRPYRSFIQNSSNSSSVAALNNLFNTSPVAITQPANTTGRLLASNCFQCHGTGGKGGFSNISRDAGDLREFLSRPASSSIMAAHAQGFTPSQVNLIISYLNQ
jgi:hypothetical protein